MVRRDLPLGVLAAQVVHAAGSSTDGHPPGTYVVVLAAEGEQHLVEITEKLATFAISHARVIESDQPYSGQLMSVGIAPVTDRSRVRKVVSSLPLLREIAA